MNRPNKAMFLLIILSITLILPVTATAQTNYVTDEFEITMRTGMGSPNSIIKILPTGFKLEVLEIEPNGKYARVSTPDGKEGWVLARYLVNKPIAKIRLENAQARIKRMRNDIANLEKQVTDLKTENKALTRTSNNLDSNKSKLEKELETIRKVSSDKIAIFEENKELKNQLVALRHELQGLEQENSGLQDSSARDWFMIGAGVCIIGILVGIMLPNVRLRRQSGWGSL